MRLTARLRIEHRVFRKLLDLMEIALALPKEQSSLELKAALDVLLPAILRHEKIEEQVLFPVFRGQGPAEAGTLAEYLDGHEEIWKTLSYLEEALEAEGSSQATAASVERLLFLLREHILEEERVLYPAIEKALGRKVLDELGSRAAKLYPARTWAQEAAS